MHSTARYSIAQHNIQTFMPKSLLKPKPYFVCFPSEAPEAKVGASDAGDASERAAIAFKDRLVAVRPLNRDPQSLFQFASFAAIAFKDRLVVVTT